MPWNNFPVTQDTGNGARSTAGPAYLQRPRFAHPLGSTELRALLRFAAFLQLVFSVCVAFAAGVRRRVSKVRDKP